MTCRLFVVGAGRSGTKFIMNVLNNSERVHLAPEMHFFSKLTHEGYMRNMRRAYGKKDYYSAVEVADSLTTATHFGTYWRRDNGFIYEDIVSWVGSSGATLKDIYSYLLEHDRDQNAKSKTDLAFLGEKTPLNVFHMNELQSWFSDARFVFIFRDPIQVLSSEVNKDSKPDYSLRKSNPLYPYGLALYVFLSCGLAALRALLFYRRFPNQIVLVNHQELSRDLPKATQSIYHWLEIPYAPSMCEVEKVDSSYSTGSAEGFWEPPGWVKFIYRVVLGPLNKMMLHRSVHLNTQ